MAATRQKRTADAGLTPEEEKALKDIKTRKVKTVRYSGRDYLKRVSVMANESSE